MTPILVIIKDNVVFSATICKDAEKLESLFLKESKKHDAKILSGSLEDGYAEIPGGGTICMIWANVAEIK